MKRVEYFVHILSVTIIGIVAHLMVIGLVVFYNKSAPTYSARFFHNVIVRNYSAFCFATRIGLGVIVTLPPAFSTALTAVAEAA